MSLNVPGVGLVTIRWLPASDEDYRDKSEGARSGYQPIAIVHHRAVANTLHSVDVTFAAGDMDPATVGSKNRPVSSHFAIGDTGSPGGGLPVISQYVDLSDTAYTNGDCQQTPIPPSTTPGKPSRWDGWYGHKAHNERTVTIEHDDNGGSSDPAVKGIVTEAIIRTSIELDRLLLSGDIARIRATGIRVRDQATVDALRKIVPGTKTLIDHNDIAGTKKPSCWRPWAADKIGFPRARYIAALTALPETSMEDAMPALSSYLPGQVAVVKTGMNVRTAPLLSATVIRVTSAQETWTVVGFAKGDLDTDCNSDQWLVRWNNGWEYTSKCNLASGPARAPDTTPFAQDDVDAARAKGIADAAAAAGAVK